MTPRRERPPAKVTPLSRRWWLAGLQTCFWVVLVTAFVWIYADMKYTDEAKLTATLVLNTGESQKILLSPDKYSLKFHISGSQSALDKFRRDLQEKRGSVITYNVAQDYPLGRNKVPTAGLLDKAAALKEKYGIGIESVEPKVIELNLDNRLVKTGIPVELDARGADLETPPAAQTVTIHVPQSRWVEIESRLKGLPASLKTRAIDLKDRKPGPHEISAEILPLIEGIEVEPVPRKLTFDVQVISPLVTRPVRLSVKILTPANWAEAADTTWKEYVFVPNPASDWRPTLKIQGRPKDIKPENVWAYIKLTDDDKKATEAWLGREVIVSFPAGVDLKLVEGVEPKVQFRLEKRKAPTPPGP